METGEIVGPFLTFAAMFLGAFALGKSVRREATKGTDTHGALLREIRDTLRSREAPVLDVPRMSEVLHERDEARRGAVALRDRIRELEAERDEARTNADNSRREAERLVEECEARMAEEREVLAKKLEWFQSMIGGMVVHLNEVQSIHSQVFQTIRRYCVEVREDNHGCEDFEELNLDSDGGVFRS
jgi:hypothetical protein